MDIVVSNISLIKIKLVDLFSSLIWTDRYSEYGDFEILVDITADNLIIFQVGFYLTLLESEHCMIVEKVKVVSDNELGDKLMISGRSLETILYQRIVWTQTILNGNLQDEIQRLLNENIIASAITNRNIPNFVFVPSIDPDITSLVIDNAQYTGDYLYDVISDICEEAALGFKVILTDDGNFEFSLYSGRDRSFNQLTRPHVVFSPKFDNLIGSDYSVTNVDLKTIALVAGEGEGTNRLTTTVAGPSGGGTGINRRELYVDARDLSKTTSSGTLSTPVYMALLGMRGRLYLSLYTTKKTFEGKIDSNVMYLYGRDFFMGDIVQTSDEYGNEGRVRIVELIFSENEEGSTIYPTFKSLE